MRVLGIDPGPTYFGWAVYDDERNRIDDWGTHTLPDMQFVTDGIDAVVIEDIVGIYQPGKQRVNTAKTIGYCQAMFPGAVLIPRETVRAVLAGRASATEADANLAFGRLVPSFADVRHGITSHVRAAACVAYVGVGRVKK